MFVRNEKKRWTPWSTFASLEEYKCTQKSWLQQQLFSWGFTSMAYYYILPGLHLSVGTLFVYVCQKWNGKMDTLIDFCVFRSVQVYTKKLVTAATFFLRVYLYGILLYFGRFAFKRGDGVPKFHYETRAFSRVIRNRLTKKNVNWG